MHDIGAVYQICFVVPDLQAAIAEWTEERGAGPFFLFEHFEFIGPDYKGEAVSPDVSLALGYSGNLNIELIQQLDDTPSVYREKVDESGYGFHHFARLTADMDQSIAESEALGAPLVFSAKFEPDTRMAYCDTRNTLGCFTEFIESNEAVQGLLAYMHEAARNWDGKDPIHPLPF